MMMRVKNHHALPTILPDKDLMEVVVMVLVDGGGW